MSSAPYHLREACGVSFLAPREWEMEIWRIDNDFGSCYVSLTPPNLEELLTPGPGDEGWVDTYTIEIEVSTKSVADARAPSFDPLSPVNFSMEEWSVWEDSEHAGRMSLTDGRYCCLGWKPIAILVSTDNTLTVVVTGSPSSFDVYERLRDSIAIVDQIAAPN